MREGSCRTAYPPRGISMLRQAKPTLLRLTPGFQRFGVLGHRANGRETRITRRCCRGGENGGIVVERKKSLNIQGNNFQNLTKIITAGSPPRVSCGGPQLQVQTHYSIVCAGAPVRRFPWRDPSKLISGANHVPSPAAPVWQRRAPGNSGTGDDCGGAILGVVVSGPVIGRPDMLFGRFIDAGPRNDGWGDLLLDDLPAPARNDPGS